MQELNIQILQYLHSFIEYSFVEKTTLIFADGPIFFLPVFLLTAWFYFLYKKPDQEKRKDLLFIFYGTIIAILINLVFQQFFHFDRPESALTGSTKLLLDHIPDASFPSDHAAVSFAFLFWVFFAGYKKIGIIFAVFVILMNLSRVILWVHWPFDIVWGFVVAIFWACISFTFLKKNSYVEKFNTWFITMLSKIWM